MPFETLFFDLDDTLYPHDTGLWNAIKARMSLYMQVHLNLPEDQIPELRRHYYRTYGTTLRGLQRHYQVEADDYLAFVHDLPLDEFLQPDPQVRSLLEGLPQSNKWIFTNADADHARRVLRVLALDQLFEGIIDVRALEFACKPEPRAYRMALELANVRQAERCMLLDDSPVNLAGARHFGIATVLVREGDPDPDADYTIPSLLALPVAVPELWTVRQTVN